MRAIDVDRLAEHAVLPALDTWNSRAAAVEAVVVALIARADAGRLYLPAGYPSMHAYCVGELHFSDDEAYKRIQVARAGRQFPVLLEAIADGRLHMTAARFLAPHLTEENAAELIEVATHQSASEIENEGMATRAPS